jgi:hypothetical protein
MKRLKLAGRADEVAKSVQRFSSYEMTPHKINISFIIPKRIILIEKSLLGIVLHVSLQRFCKPFFLWINI